MVHVQILWAVEYFKISASAVPDHVSGIPLSLVREVHRPSGQWCRKTRILLRQITNEVGYTANYWNINNYYFAFKENEMIYLDIYWEVLIWSICRRKWYFAVSACWIDDVASVW